MKQIQIRRFLLWAVFGVAWVSAVNIVKQPLLERSAARGLTYLHDAPSPTALDPKVVRATQLLSSKQVPAQEIWIQTHGLSVEIVYPVAGQWLRAEINTNDVKIYLMGALFLGVLLLWLLDRHRDRFALAFPAVRLRAKFLLTIFVINLITAVIIFISVSSLQTREQTRRIEKQSLIFVEFSTERIISSFVKDFQSAYIDRFLPEIKKVIASNEDLQKVRVISYKGRDVLFDSEKALSGSGVGGGGKAWFPPELDAEISTSDLASAPYERDSEKLFAVVDTVRAPNQEPIFLVEYFFSYRTLAQNLEAIRSQIVYDMIPSLAIGFLIALGFAKFLLAPIRRLVRALGKVSSGDYAVKVDPTSRDEVGDLVVAFNSMASELQRKEELRKFLSRSSYQRIMGAGGAGGMRMGGARVFANVLFCDIRDFVALCESLEAEEVTSLLNAYFSEMVEVIHRNGGEVDKFIGDAILAVFYAEDDSKFIQSNEQPSTFRAVICAFEMRAKLDDFNERRAAAGKPKIEIGIGLSYGELISGPIGAENRMDFTVIGDVVNVASRIEKLSKRGRHTRVLFSGSVEEKIRGLVDYEALPGEPVRGKIDEVKVFELIGIRNLHFLIRNLQSDDPSIRRRSVELLGHSRNPEATEPILSVLEDQDEGVRVHAALAVSRLPVPDGANPVVDRLIGRIRAESSFKVISALIQALGRICRSEKILVLSPFLSSPDERVVANTIEAMGQSRSAKAADLILPQLSSRNNRIKANAAMALFAAGHYEVVETLKSMLMHSEPLMRSSAAFAIGELTLIADVSALVQTLETAPARTKAFLAEMQQCVPMLVALLRDPEPMVKRQAVIALGKIRDRSAVLPMIELIEAPSAGSRELSREILEALRSIGSHRLVREVLGRVT